MTGMSILSATPNCPAARAWVALVATVLGCASGPVAAAAEPEDAIRKASADYAAAFNDRSYDSLAAQWTDKAVLVEGGSSVRGRDAIVASLRGWLERHPQSRLQIRIDRIEMPATSLARVSGTMAFTRRPGDKPVESRFESLRVLDGGVWRLVESIVVPSQAAALEAFDWLVGAWESAKAADGTTVELTFEKPLGAASLVCRGRSRLADGAVIDSLQVIHPDRSTGLVRSWVFDSTGARAEGVFDSDGVALHQTLQGTPADAVAGRVVRWVQVIAPAGEGRLTTHAIERSIDGRPLPDGPPRHFRRIR